MPDGESSSKEQDSPGASTSVTCPAIKFSYNLRTFSWSKSEVMIRILTPMVRMAKGGMRYCYEVDEITEDGTLLPMVAKFFRSSISDLTEKDYFNEAEVQCMCEPFAINFNRAPIDQPVKRPRFSFLQCYVVKILTIPPQFKDEKSGFFSFRVPDTQMVTFGMEPRLKGRFTKYNSNYGETYHNDNAHKYTPEELAERERICEAAEAFSHFTLVDSGGSMLVCDLQGLNDLLTDPQIHTEDGQCLGMGNMGMKGIQMWIEQHKCNPICKALGLGCLQPGLSITKSDSKRESTTREEYKRLQAMCRYTRPLRPTDLMPTKKPLGEMTEEEKLEYVIEISKLNF